MKWKRLNFVDRIRDTAVRNGLKGAIVAVYMLNGLVHADDPGGGNPLCWIPHFCPALLAIAKPPDPPRYRVTPIVYSGPGKGKKDCTCSLGTDLVITPVAGDSLVMTYPCSKVVKLSKVNGQSGFSVWVTSYSGEPLEWKVHPPVTYFRCTREVFPDLDWWTKDAPTAWVYYIKSSQ